MLYNTTCKKNMYNIYHNCRVYIIFTIVAGTLSLILFYLSTPTTTFKSKICYCVLVLSLEVASVDKNM